MPPRRTSTATTTTSFTTARSHLSDDSPQPSPRAPLLPARTDTTASYSTFPRASIASSAHAPRTDSLTSTMSEHDRHIVRTESGMQVLGPAPTDTSEYDDPIAERARQATLRDRERTTTFLGFKRRSPAQVLQTLQKYSSYAFTVFAAFHITNTALLPLACRLWNSTATAATQDASQYLLLTRPYYQSPLMEPIVVAIPLLTHIASGIALRAYKRHVLLKHYGGYPPLLPAYQSSKEGKSYKGAPWPKLSWQSMTGYIAVPLVLGHSFVTRGLPLKVEGGSSSIGLDYVSHGFAIAPKAHLVYYAALVSVVGTHVVWGWAKWMAWAPESETQRDSEREGRRRVRWWGVWGVSAAVMGVWMAGGLGVVGKAGLEGRIGGWVGRVYDGLYRELPVIRNWV